MSEQEQLYPDVLGMISGGVRVSMEALQCALGVFPKQAYINQPIEAVLLLQNMVDQPMQVRVSLQLPQQDKKGNVMVLDTPRNVMQLTMQPGEVGVLRVPIVAYPPTLPTTEVPVHMAVRYRTPKAGQPVRPMAGGVPPTALSISPYKLQALREVEFIAQSWMETTDIITACFDIAPKRLAPLQQTLTERYETLWRQEEAAQDRRAALAQVEKARQIAHDLTHQEIYEQLTLLVERQFLARGVSLESGEMKAVAKAVSYTLVDAMALDDKLFVLEQSRWFQALCRALAYNPNLANATPNEIVARYLFEPALYDAILLGFKILQPRVKVNLGNREERISYANKVMSWFGGQTEPDISYIYLPLVLMGVSINHLMAKNVENPWIMLNQLYEVVKQRSRQVNDDGLTIFEMLDKLLDRADEELQRLRIPHP